MNSMAGMGSGAAAGGMMGMPGMSGALSLACAASRVLCSSAGRRFSCTHEQQQSSCAGPEAAARGTVGDCHALPGSTSVVFIWLLAIVQSCFLAVLSCRLSCCHDGPHARYGRHAWCYAGHGRCHEPAGAAAWNATRYDRRFLHTQAVQSLTRVHIQVHQRTCLDSA